MTRSPHDPHLLDVWDLARFLGVSTRTIHRMRADGRLPPGTLYNDKKLVWSKDEIERVVENLPKRRKRSSAKN